MVYHGKELIMAADAVVETPRGGWINKAHSPVALKLFQNDSVPLGQTKREVDRDVAGAATEGE